mgnify:FL=1
MNQFAAMCSMLSLTMPVHDPFAPTPWVPN